MGEWSSQKAQNFVPAGFSGRNYCGKPALGGTRKLSASTPGEARWATYFLDLYQEKMP